MEKNYITCKGCKNSSNSVFKYLTAESMKLLEKEKVTKEYKKGTILYKEGTKISGIYCVNSGIIKIYKTGTDGKEQIVSFGRPGDITAFRSVLSNEPACTTAEVIEDSIICYIPASTLFSFIKTNPTFSLALLQLTCKELNYANEYIKDIAQKTVRVRLSEVLLKLESTFGVDKDGYLNITLTREELANIVGTATESVIRLLSDFKVENLISISSKKIKIINKNLLLKISELH